MPSSPPSTPSPLYKKAILTIIRLCDGSTRYMRFGTKEIPEECHAFFRLPVDSINSSRWKKALKAWTRLVAFFIERFKEGRPNYRSIQEIPHDIKYHYEVIGNFVAGPTSEYCICGNPHPK